MVKYNCKQCGKIFSQKSHYDSHNKRKTPCKENKANKNKKLTLLISLILILLIIIFIGYRFYVVYRKIDIGEKVNFNMTGKFSGKITESLWIIDAVVCKINGSNYHIQIVSVTNDDNIKESYYLDASWQANDWNANWLGGCGVKASLGDDSTMLKKVILKRNEFKKGWKYGNLMYNNTKHQPIIEKSFFGF